MYKKMVVLLDGSELAEVVFDYAQELSGRLRIDTELLHVCKPEEAGQLPMRRAYMDRMAETLCARAEKVRAQYDDSAACVQARGHVTVGYPAEEILKYVDQNDIDLILMSTHGSSGVKSWDLGAVANKIVHAAKVPVWLVPAEIRQAVIADSLPGSSTVIPLSGEKQSEVAIKHAVGLLQQKVGGSQSQLVLLQVVDAPPSHSSSFATLSEDATYLDRQVAIAKEYLEGVAQPLRDAGIPVQTEALWGDPARSIISYLKDHPTQLLVMATRGKSRISRMVFGSTTENVIQMVKVTPLLLVGDDTSL